MRSGRAAWRRFRRATRGAAAIEFALLSPILVVSLFGILGASVCMATLSGLEQITAGAARSAVAGLSDTERDTIARTYIAQNIQSYPYIDARALQIATSSSAATNTFTVSTRYNMSATALYQSLHGLAPWMPATLARQSVILNGGA